MDGRRVVSAAPMRAVDEVEVPGTPRAKRGAFPLILNHADAADVKIEHSVDASGAGTAPVLSS